MKNTVNNRSILRLAIPNIFANITVPMVGLADLAVAGHIGNTTMIGGIAVATMLFDLLYWNMGFLRVGTSGMVAQAYGAQDFRTAAKILTQGVLTALAISLIIWAIQFLYADAAFALIETTEEVERLAREYFFIRIWAAPATLANFAFKGFFIGMQNAVRPMIVDITINVVNIATCILFSVYGGMGIAGIALSTVVAQYSGLAVALFFTIVNYRKIFEGIDIRDAIELNSFRRFFAVNGNLFLRSICFLFIYTGFTSISTTYGETALAIGAIMMKIMMLYSYFADGFAYAGEALTGRYIGARDPQNLKASIRIIFKWGLYISILSTLAYILAGKEMIQMMTSDPAITSTSAPFLPWLWLMPAMSCAAFTWDGIYIGATATRPIRNSMIWAVAAFFLAYYSLTLGVELTGSCDLAGSGIISGSGDLAGSSIISGSSDLAESSNLISSSDLAESSNLISSGDLAGSGTSACPGESITTACTDYYRFGLHALFAAYIAHLIARSIYLTTAAKKHIWGAANK